MSFNHNSGKWKLAIEALRNLLESTSEGETVSYDEMSKLIGGHVTASNYALRRALSVLERKSIHFECVADEGYRRMSPSDVAVKGTKRSLLKTFRSANRGLKRASLGDGYSKLSTHERAEYHARSGVLQSIKSSANGNSVNSKIKSHRSALDDELENVRSS